MTEAELSWWRAARVVWVYEGEQLPDGELVRFTPTRDGNEWSRSWHFEPGALPVTLVTFGPPGGRTKTYPLVGGRLGIRGPLWRLKKIAAHLERLASEAARFAPSDRTWQSHLSGLRRVRRRKKNGRKPEHDTRGAGVRTGRKRKRKVGPSAS